VAAASNTAESLAADATGLTAASIEESLAPLSLEDFDTLPVAPTSASVAAPAVAPASPTPLQVQEPERPYGTSLSFEEELLAPPPAPPSAAPPATGAGHPDLNATPKPKASALAHAAAASAGAAANLTTASASSSAAPSGSAAAAAPNAASAATPPMDRDFIARNQVVERYLSGRLPLKGATEFERFCRDNPEILDEVGLPERVNAGLRLLDASGKPEPWQEAKQPFWQKAQVTIGLAAAVVVLAGALWYFMNDGAAKAQRITKLQSQAAERPLDPATSTREIRLLPSREGGSNTPAITIGGGAAQLVDFKIDESRSPYKVFRVTIDRIDQGRVAVISDLGKDSNGHLRIALNSSALGPGNYQLTIEGLTWRGEAEPDSWITIGIQR
jgi:hypothetical protein